MQTKQFWQWVLEEYHKRKYNTVYICTSSTIFRDEWVNSEAFRDYCFDMAEYYFPDKQSGRYLARQCDIPSYKLTLFDVADPTIRIAFLEKMVEISD